MKLTDPESIQESEKEFIDTINAELDWEAIEKMLLEKHSFTLQEEIDYKDGDLVVYKDNIAYKFDFEIKVPLSVIFNREGDCLEISTVRDDFDEDSDLDENLDLDQDININEEIDLDQNIDFIEDQTIDPEEDQTIDPEGDQNIDLDEDLEVDMDLNDDETDLNPPDHMEDTIEETELPEPVEKDSIVKNDDKVAQMASNIADMISEINEGDE